MHFGTLDYDNTGETVAGIKSPVVLGTGSNVVLNEVDIDVDTQGDAAASTTAYGISTGKVEFSRCEINVTNIPETPGSGLEDTYTVGIAYITDSGELEIIDNNVHVNNDGSTGIGMYIGGTVSARVVGGHLHVESTSGTANSYYIAAAGATVISQIADIIAADGINNAGGGTYSYVHSQSNANWEISGDLAVGNDATILGHLTPKGDNIYNVQGLSYGALGDGSNDDTAAIQAAIDDANTAGGGIIFFPKGTYKISSSLTLYSNIILQGVGGSSIISLAIGNDAIAATGTASGSGLALASDADAKQFDVVLADASSLSADDWIRIYSDDAFDGSATQTQSEIRQIASIAGNTLTLAERLAASYTVVNSAEVELLTMVENITVRNLKFLGGGDGENQYGMTFTYCRNLKITNCDITDFYNRGIQLWSCVVLVMGSQC